MTSEEIPDIAPEYTAGEEIAWEKNGRALPEVLDPVMTKALIQRYIETERNRNRRALLWISGIFIFVVLLILTMFLSIGIFVLNKSVAASETVEEMTLQTSAYAAEVVDMSNKLGRLEQHTEAIKSIVNAKESIDAQKEELLKSDLKRFSKWVSSKNKKDADSIVALENKLKELEQAAAVRQKEFEQVQAKYAAVMNNAAGIGAPSALLSAKNGIEEDSPEDIDVVLTSVAEAAVVGTEPESNRENATTTIADDSSRPNTARLSSGSVSVVSFPNGDKYKGAFVNGLFHGWGVYTYNSGDRYEGEFQSDMKSGNGTMFFANGDKYTGEFKSDTMNGQGTFYFNNGERYTGEFLSNRMTGKGTRFYNSGHKYEGDFKNDLRHGNGVLTFQNGDVYKGEFSDDKRTGKGTYVFTDGARYIGDFDDGRRHGRGRYIYAGGEEFIGEFRDGKREGVGLCTYPNGLQVNGLWKNDEFVRVVEE